MKKFSQVILIFTILFSCSQNLIFAKTQAELDSEIAELEAQNQAELDEISQNKLDALATEEKIISTQKQVLDTQNSIKATNTEISNTASEISGLEVEIKDTEKKITELTAEADQLGIDSGVALVGLQRLEHKNVVIDIIFSEDSDIGNVLTQLRAIGTITDVMLQNLVKLNEVLVEINAQKVALDSKVADLQVQKTNLETINQDLAIQEQTLSNQLAVSKKYQDDLSVMRAEAENSVASNNTKIAVAEENRKFLEAAGCGPNDVYGIDCAVPPPSTGGGGNGGGSSGGGGIVEVSEFRSPIKSGRVTDEFGGQGALGAPFHTGIDLGKGCGAPIYASAPGVVTYAGYKDEYSGNVVSVLHLSGGQNYVSTYNHMGSVSVSVGQNVGYGSQVGLMGSTGSSTACHLHFELNTGSIYGWDTGGNTFFDPRIKVSWPAPWVEFNFN